MNSNLFTAVLESMPLVLGLGAVVVALAGLHLLFQWYWTSHRIAARLRELPQEEELRQRLATIRQENPVFGAEKPALVLSGGGGKGAYQIGCLNALRDAGIYDYSLITGTSVGSLNAALVAQGGFDAAREIWRTISHDRVLYLVAPLRRVLSRLPLLPFYALRHLRAGRRGIPPSLWEAASVSWRTRHHPEANRKRLAEDFKSAVKKAVPFFSNLLGLSFFVTCGLWITRFSKTDTHGIRELADLVRVGWMMLPIALNLTLVVILLWIWFVWRDRQLATTAAIASNDPLRDLLDQYLDADKVQAGPLTYVTVASLRVVEQPAAPDPSPTSPPSAASPSTPTEAPAKDRPQSQFRQLWQKHIGNESDFSPAASPVKTTHQEPATQANDAVWTSGQVAYLPSYLLLQSMSAAEKRNRILDSASLPEIFPRRVFDGGDLVDGGLADNTPLMPVLQAGVKAAIVIYLSREQGLEDSEERIRQLDRNLSNSRSFGSEQRTPWTPLNGPRITLLRIVPSVSLGSLVSGTLNFTASRARQLMQLGYADTLDALEAGLVDWQI